MAVLACLKILSQNYSANSEINGNLQSRTVFGPAKVRTRYLLRRQFSVILWAYGLTDLTHEI